MRFPALFVILAAVTVADLVIPDLVPFVDEIVLALLTTIFGLWKQRRPDSGVPRDKVIDVSKQP